MLGADPATGGAGASCAGRTDAPGRRDRPAGARRSRPSASTAASMPSRATRTSCSTSSGCGRSPRTRYRRLSGGERQRLGFALALVGRPEVVVLDEPTAGMDPEARAAIRTIVADLRDAGVAILLTSHDLTDVERLADRIVVIDARPGRGRRDGRPSWRPGHVRRSGSGSTGRWPRRSWRPSARRWRRAEVRSRSWPTATARRYRVDGAAPDADLVAALAAWCVAAGSADRRAADRRRQPRGRLPRAGRGESLPRAARPSPDGTAARERPRKPASGDDRAGRRWSCA